MVYLPTDLGAQQNVLLQRCRKIGVLLLNSSIFLLLIQQFEQTHRKSMEMADNSYQGKKYSKYTRQMRLELIRMVDEDRISTAHAARLLGIKQTSACRIMRSYHHHNRIFEKKTDKLHRQRIEALKSEQKDSDFSNKMTQQKKDDAQNKIGQSGLGRAESQTQECLQAAYTQNVERRGINYSGEGMGVIIQSIINFPAEYYPIYYPNLSTFSYGYYI